MSSVNGSSPASNRGGNRRRRIVESPTSDEEHMEAGQPQSNSAGNTSAPFEDDQEDMNSSAEDLLGDMGDLEDEGEGEELFGDNMER